MRGWRRVESCSLVFVMSTRAVVTDCCGRLLPEALTLVGDVHFTEMCLACQALDGREHEQHRTCDYTKTKCPGSDWSYINGRIVPASPSS